MTKKKTLKKVLNIISTVFLVALIILLVFMFIARASGHSLSIFGFHVFRVSSGSMEPTLMTGDVILVQQTSAENIHEGDIISYKAVEGEMAGNIITHRVVTEPVAHGGVYTLQTRGDLEGAPLDPEITSDQLIGKYNLKLPLLGKLYSFFLTPQGLITIFLVIIVLFGYEMISLIVSYKSLDKKYDEYYESVDNPTDANKQENASADDSKQQ